MINVTRCMRGFRGVGWRVANPPRNAEGRREGGGELRRAETEKTSYYYQFACLRSLGLPLSSFHLDDTGGLFPPIYFSAPIRDSSSHLALFPLRTLSRNLARARLPGRENFCSTAFPHVGVDDSGKIMPRATSHEILIQTHTRAYTCIVKKE